MPTNPDNEFSELIETLKDRIYQAKAEDAELQKAVGEKAEELAETAVMLTASITVEHNVDELVYVINQMGSNLVGAIPQVSAKIQDDYPSAADEADFLVGPAGYVGRVVAITYELDTGYIPSDTVYFTLTPDGHFKLVYAQNEMNEDAMAPFSAMEISTEGQADQSVFTLDEIRAATERWIQKHMEDEEEGTSYQGPGPADEPDEDPEKEAMKTAVDNRVMPPAGLADSLEEEAVLRFQNEPDEGPDPQEGPDLVEIESWLPGPGNDQWLYRAMLEVVPVTSKKVPLTFDDVMGMVVALRKGFEPGSHLGLQEYFTPDVMPDLFEKEAMRRKLATNDGGFKVPADGSPEEIVAFIKAQLPDVVWNDEAELLELVNEHLALAAQRPGQRELPWHAKGVEGTTSGGRDILTLQADPATWPNMGWFLDDAPGYDSDFDDDEDSDPEKEAMKTAEEVNFEPARKSIVDLDLEKGSVGTAVMTPNGPGKIKKVYQHGDVELATEYADVELDTTGEIRAYPVSRLTKQAAFLANEGLRATIKTSARDAKLDKNWNNFTTRLHRTESAPVYQRTGDGGLIWTRSVGRFMFTPAGVPGVFRIMFLGEETEHVGDASSVNQALDMIERFEPNVTTASKTAAFLANETLPDFEDENFDNANYQRAMMQRGGGLIAPHGRVLLAPMVQKRASNGLAKLKSALDAWKQKHPLPDEDEGDEAESNTGYPSVGDPKQGPHGSITIPFYVLDSDMAFPCDLVVKESAEGSFEVVSDWVYGDDDVSNDLAAAGDRLTIDQILQIWDKSGSPEPEVPEFDLDD